ncbi:hypothetical protein GJAV_G00026190 [Gymnothorax javanicus]|nr:hypothetical protein GJAV_G00026190 [Gymnothorax javanicus]
MTKRRTLNITPPHGELTRAAIVTTDDYCIRLCLLSQSAEAREELPAHCRETQLSDYISNDSTLQLHKSTVKSSNSTTHLASDNIWILTMTLEELCGQETSTEASDRMQCAGIALEELLVSAKKQDCLTVGVYESAKVMNVDPDSVAFCVLATDEEYECDIALQIHFTLIQAFCFDNDINVVRVNDIERLADILGKDDSGEPKDAHCLLVTSSEEEPGKGSALEKLSVFCEESRSVYDWVPAITLPER